MADDKCCPGKVYTLLLNRQTCCIYFTADDAKDASWGYSDNTVDSIHYSKDIRKLIPSDFEKFEGTLEQLAKKGEIPSPVKEMLSDFEKSFTKKIHVDLKREVVKKEGRLDEYV